MRGTNLRTIAKVKAAAEASRHRLRRSGLNHHVASAVARQTGRGWRIDKSSADSERNIDAAVALAIAVERAQVETPTVRLVGWL